MTASIDVFSLLNASSILAVLSGQAPVRQGRKLTSQAGRQFGIDIRRDDAVAVRLLLSGAEDALGNLEIPGPVRLHRRPLPRRTAGRRQQQQQRPERALSFLIDAGATHQGYASDITRTYASTSGVFADMIRAMDVVQRELCSGMRSGVDYRDMHLLAHTMIAGILEQFVNIGYVAHPYDPSRREALDAETEGGYAKQLADDAQQRIIDGLVPHLAWGEFVVW